MTFKLDHYHAARPLAPAARLLPWGYSWSSIARRQCGPASSGAWCDSRPCATGWSCQAVGAGLSRTRPYGIRKRGSVCGLIRHFGMGRGGSLRNHRSDSHDIRSYKTRRRVRLPTGFMGTAAASTGAQQRPRCGEGIRRCISPKRLMRDVQLSLATEVG
jgi:hypothetical protein